MLRRYTIFMLLILVGGLTACKKFLDEQPKGLVIPSRISEYEGLLNSPTLTRTFPISLIYFTDDYFNSFDATDRSVAANAYYWRTNLNVNLSENPEIWGPLYRSIYNTNVIINGVETATDGSEGKKKSVKGEALVLRASFYLDLLTVFAKAYNPQTAGNDPGMPMPTSTNVTDVAPERLTLKATLDAILADVQSATTALPESNINRYRVTKYAAYGLLSRIYLYMGNFIDAKKYAVMALNAPHEIFDYNDLEDVDHLPVSDLNPQILWQRGAETEPGFNTLYAQDLLNLLNPATDLRYSFFVGTRNSGKYFSTPPGRVNTGITFPEMELVRAEVEARQGNYNEAMNVLNDLRKKRMVSSSYTDLSASSTAEALTKVLLERRLELAFGGLRWFDMKRLDQEGRMPAVRRVNPTTQAVTATLEPHSNRYTFEIPLRVLQFNPGMQRNH